MNCSLDLFSKCGEGKICAKNCPKGGWIWRFPFEEAGEGEEREKETEKGR